jgi:hypothetical protein
MSRFRRSLPISLANANDASWNLSETAAAGARVLRDKTICRMAAKAGFGNYPGGAVRVANAVAVVLFPPNNVLSVEWSWAQFDVSEVKKCEIRSWPCDVI